MRGVQDGHHYDGQAWQRHSPRRIAKHPELSGLLPLPARKMMSSELGLVCLDDLRGRDAYEEKRKAYDEKRKDYDEKRKIDRKDYQIILGYYRNNDYIVTGKRLHEAMPAWFCKTRILRLFI